MRKINYLVLSKKYEISLVNVREPKISFTKKPYQLIFGLN